MLRLELTIVLDMTAEFDPDFPNTRLRQAPLRLILDHINVKDLSRRKVLNCLDIPLPQMQGLLPVQ